MIRELTEKEFAEIYKQYMEQDFPADELKPLGEIESQRQRQTAICLGFFHQRHLAGYAVLQRSDDLLLLDYFAVLPRFRHQGLGTLFLRQLREIFADQTAILIESEAADTAEAQRRLAFYQRAGAVLSEIRIHLVHVDYRILMLPLSQTLTDKQLHQALLTMYRTIYSEPFRNRYLRIGPASEAQ